MRALCQERYGWPVYPLDLGWEGLRYGREMGLERLAQADLRALPFQADAFDLVMSLDVIVHLPRGEEDCALREMARVLVLRRPAGAADFGTRISCAAGMRNSQASGSASRADGWKRRSKRHGIKVLRCTYANSLLMPVALARFRVWEPLTRQPAASGVEPVARWLDRLLYVASGRGGALAGRRLQPARRAIDRF